MKIISMLLGDEEIARVEDGVFKNVVEPANKWEGAPNNLFKTWYEDCFYAKKADTFDERFERAKEQDYFCYSKPHIKLAARTIDARIL